MPRHIRPFTRNECRVLRSFIAGKTDDGGIAARDGGIDSRLDSLVTEDGWAHLTNGAGKIAARCTNGQIFTIDNGGSAYMQYCHRALARQQVKPDAPKPDTSKEARDGCPCLQCSDAMNPPKQKPCESCGADDNPLEDDALCHECWNFANECAADLAACEDY